MSVWLNGKEVNADARDPGADPNAERDLRGYRVYRQRLDGQPTGEWMPVGPDAVEGAATQPTRSPGISFLENVLR